MQQGHIEKRLERNEKKRNASRLSGYLIVQDDLNGKCE